MNGLAVLLCMSALGVQQTWRNTPEGHLEYVLQVEPTFLASLEQGESITSDLPASAKEVHRLCLRISAGDLKKLKQWKLEVPPLATAEERAALSEPDIPVAIIVDAEGNSQETTDISHGWQATNDGRVKYVVQLAPDLLGKLREGDEIYMNLYPEAAKIQQFIVVAGQNVLPRKGPRLPAHVALTSKNHRTIAPAAAETENPKELGPVAEESSAARLRGPRTKAPAAESRPFGPWANEPARLRDPRYSVNDDANEQPKEPDDQSLYGRNDVGNGGAPELITETPADGGVPEEQQPRYGAVNRGPRTTPPPEAADESPEFDPSQFDRDQFANSPVNKPKMTSAAFPKPTRASLTPPDNGQEYAPEYESRRSKNQQALGSGDGTIATTSGEDDRASLDDNRTASLNNTRGKAGLSAGKMESARNPSPAAGEAAPASFGAWGFVCCALFLSIGGNLYLGWTAAEFYQRYRQAIDRTRGNSRGSDDD